MQARAAPHAPHEIPKRASSRHLSAALTPVASGNRALSGTRTSTRESSAVLDARNDSLFLMTRDSNPLVPFSTRNAVTPSSLVAQTTATSARAPFVIQ